MNARHEIRPGYLLGDLFRIESELGRGGMGVVYLAEELELGRRVALKVISPALAEDEGFRARFEREARMAASIDHPNVVPVLRRGIAEGLLYLSMQYVRGTDLKALLRRDQRLAPRVATRIVAQVAAALDVAHARGLIHRDVKPSNVLISGEGESAHAYLTDFGLTKEATAETSGLTGTGAWVGTVDYVAPEQIEGGAIDGRCDVYALGCVLFEVLSGRIPYIGDEIQTIYAHLSKPAPSLVADAPEVAERFDPIVARAMARDPDDRYPSAGDLGRAALAAAEGRVVAAPERSVAVGAAAPAEPDTAVAKPGPETVEASTRELPPAAASTSPAGAPPTAEREEPVTVARPTGVGRRPRRALLGLLAAALVATGAGAAILAGSDGGDSTPIRGAGPEPDSDEPEREPRPQDELRLAAYTSPVGFTAQIPAGPGWGDPVETEPTPGRLFRTTMSGPDGLFLAIDFTPAERPEFGGSFDSQRSVSHPTYGSATEYVFSESSVFAQCNPGPCVDYLVEDGVGGGFGVLSAGGDFDFARQVALRVARSLVRTALE